MKVDVYNIWSYSNRLYNKGHKRLARWVYIFMRLFFACDIPYSTQIGKDVEYSMEFDILPTLPAIDLEKITVVKKVAKLDEKEVETALENIRKSRSVAEKQDEKSVVFEVKVANEDMGKVIGRQGRLAKSIRTVAKSIGAREHKKVSVEFID